jgi:hypothetical protein
VAQTKALARAGWNSLKGSGDEAFNIRVGNIGSDLDPPVAHVFGEMVARDPVASRAYAQLQQRGTMVTLDFGAPPASNIAGRARPVRGQVDIFMRNARSLRDAISTLVHESSHIVRASRGGRIATLHDEYMAFRREFLFEHGRRPTLLEREGIWKTVEERYPDLPRE